LGNTGILSSALRDPNTGNGAIGNAGSINVDADTIEIINGAGIRSDTQSMGQGGTINVTADNLTIIGAGNDPAITNDRTGITSDARSGSTGNAGVLTIKAQNMMLRGGGIIRSNSRGKGNAGSISVYAGNDGRVVISDDASRSVTGISSAAEATSSGDAGQIVIQAQTILLRDGAVVSTQNDNDTGAGGPISISASDTFEVDRASVRAETKSGKGGDVSLSVGRLFDLHSNSTVTTSAAGGEGSGGNIEIATHLMVLDRSKVTANAFGGPGGNITIRADQLIRSSGSVIDASSKEDVAGTVTITSPNSDVMSGLVALPGTFLDAASRLRETCASRSGRPSSSIIAGGSGGLPPDPSAPVGLSPFMPPAQRGAAGSSTALSTRSPLSTEPVTVAGFPRSILGSPQSACRAGLFSSAP
jgi:large exoprotein involved in heme utilization and adhesion